MNHWGTLLVVALAVTGVEAGCSKSASKPECVYNSDCAGSLVCVSGHCGAQCESSKDCEAPQQCVGTGTSAACMLPDETRCLVSTDCHAPLVCAPDRNCRNQCATLRDCVTGQLCTSGVCANPDEVNAAGQLLGGTPSGGLPDGGDAGCSKPGSCDGGRHP